MYMYTYVYMYTCVHIYKGGMNPNKIEEHPSKIACLLLEIQATSHDFVKHSSNIVRFCWTFKRNRAIAFASPAQPNICASRGGSIYII